MYQPCQHLRKCQTNPKEIWNKLYNLGPKKDAKINKVYKNGNLTTDRQDILDQRYKDPSSLYNPSFVKTYEHTKFADNIVEEMFEIEQNVDTNEEFNKPISIVEV